MIRSFLCVSNLVKRTTMSMWKRSLALSRFLFAVFCISLIIYLERTCADINRCFLLTGVYRDRRCWYPALSWLWSCTLSPWPCLVWGGEGNKMSDYGPVWWNLNLNRWQVVKHGACFLLAQGWSSMTRVSRGRSTSWSAQRGFFIRFSPNHAWASSFRVLLSGFYRQSCAGLGCDLLIYWSWCHS